MTAALTANATRDASDVVRMFAIMSISCSRFAAPNALPNTQPRRSRNHKCHEGHEEHETKKPRGRGGIDFVATISAPRRGRPIGRPTYRATAQSQATLVSQWLVLGT